MWLEKVDLTIRRHSRITPVVAGGILEFAADYSRVAIRLALQLASGIAAQHAELQMIPSTGGGTVDLKTVMLVNTTHPVDQINIEEYGDLVTQGFFVRANAVSGDCTVVEIFNR